MRLPFLDWIGRTVHSLCNRPDHLQRLAIIGAGVVMYPTVLALIWIVWRGYDRTLELQSQSLGIMGFALYGSMALWGLVVVALLGIVKGIRIDGPGGIGIEIDTTADDPDVDPGTVRHEDHGRDRRPRRPAGPSQTVVVTQAAPAPAAPPAIKQPPTISD